MKNFYELLSLPPSAPPEEIKRAFRLQIARYHPDKVQHLGVEFQEIAATRAAELTEAYRTLMSAELRAEYDRLLSAQGVAPAPAEAPPGSPATETSGRAPSTPPDPAPSPHGPPRGGPEPAAARQTPAPTAPPGSRSTLFAEERQTRDVFVRAATLERIRKIVVERGGRAFREETVRGFDLAWVVKARLFGKGGLHLLVRLTGELDRAAIQDTWTATARVLASDSGEACVLLLGRADSVHAAGRIVAELKRRPGKGPASLSVVPVDYRDWSVQVPDDLPDRCRPIVESLKAAKQL